MANTSDNAVTAEQLLALYVHFDQALTAAGPVTAADTATAIIGLGVTSIPGVEQASISEGRNGRFRTLASTGAMATGGDLIQYELRSGPCVDAITDNAVYRTGDVAADTRWPEFGQRATTETGTRSMLSYRLYFENDLDRATGLNLYSTQPDAFTDTAHTVGTVLATHSARVLQTATARDQAAHLTQALDSNREIGTAMGIIMAIHKVTREDAFALLRMASQNGNRKLLHIATDVVDTGILELPTPRPRPTPAATAD